MRYEILVTKSAKRDLDAIYKYISESDSLASADHVLEQLLNVIGTLATLPERGTCPKELQALGIREYHQHFFKPYRIIYRILRKQVSIALIVDGRRDMPSIFAHRLLGPLS